MFRFTAFVVLILCFSFALCTARAMAATADWVITINTKVVEPCLNYPNSKLNPLIRSSIYFEQNVLETSEIDKELQKRGAEPDIAIPQTLYEYLYSSHLRTVGMRRYKQLDVKPGTTGIIKVAISNSSYRQEEINAAGGAVVRIYLDLYLNKMPLRSIVVQKDAFDAFIQELQRHGFRTVTRMPGQLTQSVASLSIRSEPAGRQQLMNYGM
ncbi:MAG: hypothetical protein DKT66_01540 [Candidatus Melainabacteria bacterium]|nr:MAG: hypothetical protein DKT66_01540 [Candidatus Melainabacteria bacterium]